MTSAHRPSESKPSGVTIINPRTLTPTSSPPQVVQALLVALLQLTYTSMFGWYASAVFLRTGRLAPCILCHTFCNFMGLPDLSFVSRDSYMPTPSGLTLYPNRYALLGKGRSDCSMVGLCRPFEGCYLL